MSAKKLISIVTPCYNEEENVDNHYARVSKMIEPFREKYDFEHIYTDNCSQDRTFEKLNDLHQRNSAVKVLRFSRNIGGDKAMFFGLQHATGDAVILIQADLQDPPEMIPTFIENWEQGFDVVYGKITKRDEGQIIQNVRKVFYRIIRALSDVPIPTDAGDFRLTSRRALDAILQFKENDLYMRGAVAQVGYRQKGIEYVRADREGGRSSVNLVYLIGYAINGLLSTTLVPIRAVSILGFVMAFFGFLFTVVLVFGRIFFSNSSPQGFTTLACLITLFAGVQVLSIGIIGEYLRKTYVQTLQRPRGFVQDKIGF